MPQSDQDTKYLRCANWNLVKIRVGLPMVLPRRGSGNWPAGSPPANFRCLSGAKRRNGFVAYQVPVGAPKYLFVSLCLCRYVLILILAPGFFICGLCGFKSCKITFFDLVSALRVTLLTIEKPDTISGKNTSIERLRRGLLRCGVEAEAVSTGGLGRDRLLEVLGRLKPELLHGFHAYKAGRDTVWLAEKLGVPSAITASGTDLNLDIYVAERRDEIIPALRRAGCVIVPNQQMELRLRRELCPEARVRLIKKGARLPEAQPPRKRAREALGFGNEIVFLFPAGIRRVKNNIFPLEPLDRLRKCGARIALIYLGRIIEEDYAREFMAALSRYGWARFRNFVGRDDMSWWYSASDVVLNTSHAEGCSNVVLEAMASGRTVLASDIAGNRAAIDFREDSWQSSSGLLYRVESESEISFRHYDNDFYRKAARLASTRHCAALWARTPAPGPSASSTRKERRWSTSLFIEPSPERRGTRPCARWARQGYWLKPAASAPTMASPLRRIGCDKIGL